MAKSSASINLLGRKQTTADVVLGWALTTGRLIIILTETIALSAFAYRFVLDRQIIDLHDSIKEKQAVIEFYKKDEEKFRILQNKLITLTDIESKSTEVTSNIEEFYKLAEGKVILQNLTVQPQSVQIIASTPTINLMNSFITSLKQHPRVTGVNISQIENKTETGQISITIEATLSEKQAL